MTTQQIKKLALKKLGQLQTVTKNRFPVGVTVKSPRGRGIAHFRVVGYPTPVGLREANSVIGESQKGKQQVLFAETIL
jgi:hypothetical protein